MKINCNKKIFNIKNNIKLNEFIKTYYTKNNFGIAVSVNKVIIPKLRWSKYNLCNGDNIIIFHAITGG